MTIDDLFIDDADRASARALLAALADGRPKRGAEILRVAEVEHVSGLVILARLTVCGLLTQSPSGTYRMPVTRPGHRLQCAPSIPPRRDQPPEGGSQT